MLHLLLVIATITTGFVLSRPVPTEELLQDRFALGQKYYAANDHENSVEVFQEIENTPNYRLLDVDQIEVHIDDLVLPLRVAATYQLGNSYRNVGRTLLDRARSLDDEGDSTQYRLRRLESLAAFDKARSYYRSLVDDEGRSPLHVRVMSQYQIVRASYQTEDYAGVVQETQNLLERFPGSAYEDAALYDRGWAYYYMEQYRDAISTFEELLSVSEDALKRDRSLFQMGESYVQLSEHEQARTAYGRLVSQYDFSELSNKELLEMKAQRLRGLVQETTRELIAKAQIRIADSYAIQGRVSEAIEAYSEVPEKFPQETLIVQKSYDNMATMVLEQQGTDPGIRVLRQAIEQVDDTYFRGRAQLRVAGILFRDGRYREAIDEYQVYRRAYGSEARAIGVSLDEILFSEGEAYRELARSAAAAGEENASSDDLHAASVAYATILQDYPYSQRRAEALYGQGQLHIVAGDLDSAAVSFAGAADEDRTAAVAPHALSWWARTTFQTGDAEGAADLYRRLIAEYPASELVGSAWKDLGLVYKSVDRLDEAITALMQVDQGFATWPKVQAEAADMLLAAGRLDEIDNKLQLATALQVAAAAGDDESVAELHYVLGRVARESGDYGGELEHFSRTLEATDNGDLASFARFFRGIAHYQSGAALDAVGDSLSGGEHFQESVTDLEGVLAAGGSAEMRLVAFRTRGVALTRLGQSEDAVRAYEDLIATAPSASERAEFQLMLMELYYDLGRLAQTKTTARNLIGSDFEEDDSAEFAIRDRAYFVLVSVLLEEDQYADAHRAAQSALRRFPASANRPTLMMVSARALFFNEEYNKAAAAFGRFVDTYPQHVDAGQAMYQKGYAHEILGEYESAAGAFRAVSSRYPEHPLVADGLYRAGENLYNASHFEDALVAFLAVVDRHSGTEAAEKSLYSASWTYMDLDREEESLGAMRRLVDEYPGSGFARYAQFSIGDYYYSKKRFEDAQLAYEKVVRLFPGTDEASKASNLIADVREDLASLAYEGAFEHFQRGDYAAASRGFEQIYEAYPGSYSALAALANKGVALEHLGDSAAARLIYERVLSAATDDPETSDISKFARLRLENL
jgi:tetratricopeptide (TPR) repeat protein